MGKISLKDNYEDVLARIQEISKNVTLVAVSKTVSPDIIKELYHLGHRDFGENYVQELVEKAKILSNEGCDQIRWHFIGHLQTNKVKTLLPYCHCIHSIDSEKLAAEISKQWIKIGRSRPIPVFLEVRLSNEPTKSGFSPEKVVEACNKIGSMKGLDLQGLMCIPDPNSDSNLAFVKLRDLEFRCRPWTKGKLSMGMSNDYEHALRRGATHIRVGTKLFGSRPPKASD